MARPRGRPRTAVAGEAIGSTVDSDTGVVTAAAPPPQVDSTVRKEMADQYKEWLVKYELAIAQGSDQVPNLKYALDLMRDRAAMLGIDPRTIADQRSDTDKMVDAVNEFVTNGRSPLEMHDDEITALEKVIAKTISLSQEAMEFYQRKYKQIEKNWTEADQAKYEAEIRKAEEGIALGKLWGDRLTRVRRLQRLARTPIPQDYLIPGTNCRTVTDPHVMEASHLLRYMAYVMRTNISERQKEGGAAAILDLKIHHAKIALAVYMARKHLNPWSGGLRPGGKHEGAIIVIPPGTGKTTSAVGFFSREISWNPHLKLLIAHARNDEAVKNLKYLASFFDPTTPTGRRRDVLYPGLKIAELSDKRMTLHKDEKSRQYTLAAAGIRAKISGADADMIWFDDPVDVSERDEESTRRKTIQAINGNWLTRLRGNRTFHLTTTTLWHEDDANSRRIEMVRLRKIDLVVLRLRCGGPNDVPAFKSIWPENEALSVKRLKQIYQQDPAMYAAAYMSNPRPEEFQIIRKLRYYDPNTPEHREFLKTAMFYLSIDPAATAREKSDKAAIVYAAVGTVSGTRADGKFAHEKRMRILSAKQIHATVASLKEYVASFAVSHRVDYVGVEVVAFSAALPEQLKNELNIDAIEFKPGNKNKEIRLRSVSTLIDDSKHGGTTGGAVVEFPGYTYTIPGVSMQSQEPICDKDYEWLTQQFLRFGATNDDHAVDAVTQLAGYLSRTGEIEGGAGWVTQKIRETAETGNNRVKDYIRQLMFEARNESNGFGVESEEAAFFGG